MKEFKGDRLHVNLGASQVRKRLKRVGLGVKKVQAIGTGQAVIVHTATGQHLHELESLFADVLIKTADADTEKEKEDQVDEP